MFIVRQSVKAPHDIPDGLRYIAEQALVTDDWSTLDYPEGLEKQSSIEVMRRAGHRILFVHWHGAPYVLKFFADFKDRRTGRRIEFLLKNTLTNFALRSFLGAEALQQAGVPSIQPVACMTTPSTLRRRGVFIYHHVQADQTLGEWFANNPEDSRREGVFMQLAELINDVRVARLIQPDLVKSNILVQDLGDRVTMTFIDTDDVRFLPSRLPDFLFRLLFVWSLRRMRVPATLRLDFFRVCLGDDFTEGWYRFCCFIQDNNFKPWKRLVRRLKKTR
ncbi:MAG: hypothetical protein LAT65_18760 [Saccharospirillum sp.]|nr:hypothetical protein [Saccharospirillum sp.]